MGGGKKVIKQTKIIQLEEKSSYKSRKLKGFSE